MDLTFCGNAGANSKHSISTAAGLALCHRGILAMMTHPWVPVGTRSTPVPVATDRLWVAPQANDSSHAERTALHICCVLHALSAR